MRELREFAELRGDGAIELIYFEVPKREKVKSIDDGSLNEKTIFEGERCDSERTNT